MYSDYTAQSKMYFLAVTSKFISIIPNNKIVKPKLKTKNLNVVLVCVADISIILSFSFQHFLGFYHTETGHVFKPIVVRDLRSVARFFIQR